MIYLADSNLQSHNCVYITCHKRVNLLHENTWIHRNKHLKIFVYKFISGSIIQDVEKLRQLDNEEVTKEERLMAGYKVSSDESEDDETDDCE